MNPQKLLFPVENSIHRETDTDGFYSKDCITLWDEPVPDGEPLLIPIVIDGKLVYNFLNLTEIQEHTQTELTKLRDSHQVLSDAKPYLVEVHPRLKIE